MSYQSVQIDYIRKKMESTIEYSPCKISMWAIRILFLKRKENRSYQTEERPKVVHAEALGLKEKDCQQGKYREGDNLLNNLQLEKRKWTATTHKAYTVGGNRQAVLKESHAPAQQDDDNQWEGVLAAIHISEFEVAIPRESHKDIRQHQHTYCY